MIDRKRALWLDVEASGFGNDSYPIEVGWSDIDGVTDGVLIRPAPDWTHWDSEAEGVHGISRDKLARDGIPLDVAVKAIATATAGRVVFSDSPLFDMAWLFRLFTTAGWPGVPFRLEEAESLVTAIARQRRIGIIGGIEAEIAAQRLAPITHRAADDARYWATFTRLVLGDEVG
jgi:hypothetical protein